MERIKPERRPGFGSTSRVGRRGAETHARILDAALRVLEKSGLGGVRVEAITELANCSRPTFYQYFADTGELFGQLVAQVGDELGQLVRTLEPIDSTPNGRRALRAWLGGLVSLHSRYAAVFQAGNATVRDEVITRGAEERALQTGRRFADVLQSPLPTRAPLEWYAAMVFRTVSRACSQTGSVDRDRLIDGMADWTHRCFFGWIEGVNAAPGSGSHAAPSRSASEPEEVPGAAMLGARATRSRERLLRAAVEVFGRTGYEAARIDEIAREAGYARATLYRYFDSKEVMFRELVRPAVEDMLLLLEELPEPRGGFYSWSRRLYQTYTAHGKLLSLLGESESSRSVSADFRVRAAQTVGAALSGRPFGDSGVDTLLLIAHTERGPYMASAYPRFAQTDAIAATAEILPRAFFGCADDAPSGSRSERPGDGD